MRRFSHSVRITAGKCRGRMACMRACPTEAIRVRRGKASLLEDRCIDCGECVRACPHGAIVAATAHMEDLSRFRYKIALPSPALFGQFPEEIPPEAVLASLLRVGFDEACEPTAACDAVARAVGEYLNKHPGPWPLISPFCPTVVRLVQARYPSLAERLIPIDSPMEIAAREIRERRARQLGLAPHQIGIISLTPCPPQMVAVKYPPRKKSSNIDAVVAISEIFEPALRVLSSTKLAVPAGGLSGTGLGWAVLGGQLEALSAESCLAVGGLDHVERILGDAEDGKLAKVRYLECQACAQGCCGGSLTVENPYVARTRILKLAERCGAPRQPRQFGDGGGFQQTLLLPGKLTARPLAPLDEDISVAISKRTRIAELLHGLPKIDCGACGSPTCRSFAEDVVLGRAVIDDCDVLIARRSRRHLDAAASSKHPATTVGARVRERSP